MLQTASTRYRPRYLGVNILGACMSLGLWFLFTFEWCWFVEDDEAPAKTLAEDAVAKEPLVCEDVAVTEDSETPAQC